ncbi:MAG: hypothetical protein IPP71_23275 [Bacteroidetes bacterium]|nr:hypothetical protein [Bacteroidota bacterium]
MKLNLKVKNIVLIILVTIQSSNALGQFIIPSPSFTEYQTSVTVGAYNTGNDILDFGGNNYFVSVSSSLNNAGLYWNFNNGSATGYAYFASGASDIYHADVCLVVDQNNNEIHAIVGWYYGGTLGSPSFYIEDYLWDGSSAFNYVTSTFVNGTFGTTLNVDGDDLGNFIMVYDESNTLYALSGDINFGSFNMNNSGNAVTIGLNSGLYPDVSIYSDATPGNQIVHLTYVDGSGDLNIEYDTYSNIAANTPSFTAWTGPISPATSGYFISNPRIASPNSSGAYDDWTVVWQEDDRTMTYYIKGLNSKGGSLSAIYTYNDGTYTNSVMPLFDVQNSHPVVAYDYNSTPTIWIGWIFDNRTGFYGYMNCFSSLYPIGLKCNDVALPDPAFDYWQVPNIVTNDLEIYPLSLASRYASSDQLLLTYYFANSTPEVWNKNVSSSSAIEFRIDNNVIATSDLNDLIDKEKIFILFDSKGNKVLEHISKQNEMEKLMQDYKLPPSIYFLQVISDKGKTYIGRKLFIN